MRSLRRVCLALVAILLLSTFLMMFFYDNNPQSARSSTVSHFTAFSQRANIDPTLPFKSKGREPLTVPTPNEEFRSLQSTSLSKLEAASVFAPSKTTVAQNSQLSQTHIETNSSNQLILGLSEKPFACRMPHLEPWSVDIVNYTKDHEPSYNCRKEYPMPLTYIHDRKWVKINSTVLKLEIYARKQISNCSVQYIGRKYDLMPILSDPEALSLDSPVEIPELEQFIYVTCGHPNTYGVYPYWYHHVRVVATPEIKEKQRLARGTDKFSVLLVMNDAVSHMNGLRQLPKTLQYLKSKGALQIHGFHTVGVATLPNMVPYMTGHSVKELPASETTNQTTGDYIDRLKWPLLWLNFTQNNYVTGYAEDTFYSTFNFMKAGFKQPPTDFYPKPHLDHVEATEFASGYNEMPKDWNCYREKSSHQTMIEFMDEFLKVNPDPHTPFFYWSFYNILSHAALNRIVITDSDYQRFFQRHFESGRLNNTVVIFSSDHGQRFSGIRETLQGRQEERLPLQYVTFPLTFKTKHSNLYRAFRANLKTVTTPFDMHETLLDVINPPETPRIHRPDDERKYKRGLSLFGVIPHDRTCRDAGIPDSVCVCKNLKPIEDLGINSSAHEAATALVEFMNKRLADANELECYINTLHRVIRAEREVRKQNEINQSAFETLIITFETSPAAALFEGTVKHYPEENRFEVQTPVSRINEYGSTSSCVKTEKVLKNFCYCKSLRPKIPT